MIENIGYTPTRKRANRIQNSIEDVLTESITKTVEEKDNFFLESSMNRDIALGSTRSISEVGKTIAKEKKKKKEFKLESYMICEAFANIVYQAIPLDEDFKEKNRIAITEKASATFKGLCENGVVKEGNYVWNNYLETVCESLPALKENAGDLIEVEKILQETEARVKHSGAIIAGIIESKVIGTVKDEKILAENREELMKENKKFNGKSLFNAMSVNNLKMVNSEDKYIELPEDKLLDIALAETLVDYTIIESLNTLDLVKFDVDSISKAVKHL